VTYDSGVSLKTTKWLFFEAGIYLLNEKSILWYPDEEVRNIFLYSLMEINPIKLIQYLFNIIKSDVPLNL